MGHGLKTGKDRSKNPSGLTKGYDHSSARGTETEPRGSLTETPASGCCPARVGSEAGFQDGLAVPAHRSGSGAKLPANTGNSSRGTGLVWGQGHTQVLSYLKDVHRTCTSARWDLASTTLSDKEKMELSESGRYRLISLLFVGLFCLNCIVAERFLGWPSGKHNSEGL